MGKIKGIPSFEKKIRDMMPGETGFTVPWALSFDETGHAYLNTTYTFHNES